MEILAGMLNVDRKEFSEYWEKTASLRYSTNRASIEYVKDFYVSTGKTPSEQLLASADEAIGRYQDLAIPQPTRRCYRIIETAQREWIEARSALER